MLNRMHDLTDGDDQVLRVLAASWIAAEYIPQNSGQRRRLIESVVDQYVVNQAKAKARNDETMALLGIWRSHLGSNRDSCDEAGKKIWDRIAALQPPVAGASCTK